MSTCRVRLILWFVLVAITQWLWIFSFLFLVEEPELCDRFGETYEAYRQEVPMLLPRPQCAVQVLKQPVDASAEESAGRMSA